MNDNLLDNRFLYDGDEEPRNEDADSVVSKEYDLKEFRTLGLNDSRQDDFEGFEEFF